ncbi:MAG TPA: lipopolysaccharide heptosyltransferase II [Candidatus Deferrimicrobiaceae bacterium]
MHSRMKTDPPAALLVRAVNWLGDAVLTTPALGAVRAAFPRTRITVAAKPLVAELFRHHPDIDDILVYEKEGRHAGAGGMLRMAGELHRRRFGAAILFQNAFDAALLAFLAGIPDRKGYATDGRRLLLSRAVPVSEEVLRLHHAEYYLHLVAELGIPRPANPAMHLQVTGAERDAMSERLGALGIPKGGRILGINPGATYGSAKRWYPDRFAAAADALSEEWGASVVLMGSAPEMPLSTEIEAAMRRRPVNLAGRTTVRELMALLSLCGFLVTNDSGPMHIAAALGVPLAAIFGPTDWRTTSPWTRRARIVRVGVDCSSCMRRECDRGHECMLGVTADMVIEAARDLMAESV